MREVCPTYKTSSSSLNKIKLSFSLKDQSKDITHFIELSETIFSDNNESSSSKNELYTATRFTIEQTTELIENSLLSWMTPIQPV
ncbi:MAG: hypothetical protein LBQ00_04375 [Syntrophobacterales bacterium]|jgi:hypothetical protein|nr:hypothetical protein [Syntrophobacterales bacterium]